MTHESEKEGMTLWDTRMTLSSEVQALLPDGMKGYYEGTNNMHCGEGEGGSKFEGVSNIFEVIGRRPDLAERVEERVDDREALRALGTPDNAFLPATKTPEDPPGLPEALYYKVEGVEGRLGIDQIGNFPEETRVLVRREKGQSDPDKRNYTPVSFTVIRGTVEDMPRTDFGTIIVGRSGGDEAVWTVHPGMPVRPVMGEFDFTKGLRSPEEGGNEARVMTLREIMNATDFTPNDYVKITPGNIDEVAEKYNVLF